MPAGPDQRQLALDRPERVRSLSSLGTFQRGKDGARLTLDGEGNLQNPPLHEQSARRALMEDSGLGLLASERPVPDDGGQVAVAAYGRK